MTWADVRARLLEQGGTLVVPLSSIVHPREAGATSAVGLPRGQSEDWRFPADERCSGLHAQRFGDSWRVHVDDVHPDCSLVDHARTDAPGVWVGGATLLGGIFGHAFGSTLTGALVGATVGAATVRRKVAK